MTNALVVLSLMAIILLFVAYRQDKHIEGLKEAKSMFLAVLPMLLFAFIIVGFIDILIPKEALQAWLGEESGWRGLIIGPAIGALIQGGPFAFFPLFNTIFRDSVTTGTAVAMITAWGMINIGHLPYEFTFLGPRFVALKYSIYIAIPSLAGLLANLLFR
ncbi:permease [Candidatus Contubernalis alkaliaceticus]|uniref:permease n=1 Tax=Candidatus Contubernalis alkaliaceticus TaxID=338645 RepID=UPI001F4C2EAC|nr:permease [Candidatus Contubernalis alkalaceticus]UNC92187.1 permease [Candidatus Contubernalis alkalaceticus]